MSKKKQILKEKISREKELLLDKISLKNGCIFSAVIILLSLLLFYKPYVFEKLEPAGFRPSGTPTFFAVFRFIII